VQVAKEKRTYAEERKDVPEFQRFWKEVDKYVTDLSEKAGTPEPTEPELGELTPEEKFRKDRLKITGYEAVQYDIPDGEKAIANFWWDKERVHWEKVGPDGTSWGEVGSNEAKTEAEAKEWIEKAIKGLKDKGAEYKRHMRFSVGEDGKLSLVEGKEDEFLIEVEEEKDVLQPSELREGEPEEEVPEEPETPEEAADVQLWKSINELKKEKDKVKKEYEGKMGAGNAQREDFDSYLDTIQPWEAALYGYNDFINSKLPPIERDDLKGNKDYERYLKTSRNLSELQRRIKEARSVEDQEKLLTTYQNSISAKWRIYKRLGAQGLIK
jgi:hypothetical protein